MAIADYSHTVNILVGPTCPSCETDDLLPGAPTGALRGGACGDCGTEYRWYRMPTPDGGPLDPVCPGCGVSHDAEATGTAHCEDCTPSHCLYCGVTTFRSLLSANHACQVCETGEAA
jgi:hypothetical protein